MNKTSILVVDDEEQIRKLLHITLQSNHYHVLEAVTGKEGMQQASMNLPDLILLDLGLPDINGQDVLKSLRKWYTKPIIIVSVRNSEEEIIQALDNGANDYLVKPFRAGELLARIRSALRDIVNVDDFPVAHFQDLSIDFANRIVKKKNVPVKLTATEYSLLELFARNENRVLTHHYLLKEVWGPAYQNESQYLRVFIAQLRKKIELDPNRPMFITTESGVGYRFIGKDEPDNND